MPIKLISLFLFVILSTGTQAREWHAIEGRGITILYSPSLKIAAEEMAVIYPGIKSELEKSLNLEVNFSPTIILEDDHDRFLKMSGHPLVVGFAVPERSLIVIDYTKMNKNPFSLASITKHELCHLLLHYYIAGDRLPKWLDEGVAQWVSGGLADIVMADYSRLDRAVVTGRHIRIRNLEDSFPRKEEYLVLAYEESKSIVEYMVRQYGPGGVLELLDSLRTGHNINEAVLKSFSVTFDELEGNWYSALKKNATWFVLFVNHIYEFLFFFAAVSLIIAYIRILIRKRSLREEEETFEEEY